MIKLIQNNQHINMVLQQRSVCSVTFKSR